MAANGWVIKHPSEEARRLADRESQRAWKLRNKRPATEAERAWKAEYDRAYRAKNGKRINARVLAWKHEDKRRRFADSSNQVAAAYGTTDHLDWRDITFGPCAYCDAAEPSGWDHVVPLARGGANTADNLVPCCSTCNQAKRHRTPDEWIAGIWPKMAKVSARRSSRAA